MLAIQHSTCRHSRILSALESADRVTTYIGDAVADFCIFGPRTLAYLTQISRAGRDRSQGLIAVKAPTARVWSTLRAPNQDTHLCYPPTPPQTYDHKCLLHCLHQEIWESNSHYLLSSRRTYWYTIRHQIGRAALLYPRSCVAHFVSVDSNWSKVRVIPRVNLRG